MDRKEEDERLSSNMYDLVFCSILCVVYMYSKNIEGEIFYPPLDKIPAKRYNIWWQLLTFL